MAKRDSREAGGRRPEERHTYHPPVEGVARQPSDATPPHPGAAPEATGRETSITRGMRAAAERSEAARRAERAGRTRRRQEG